MTSLRITSMNNPIIKLVLALFSILALSACSDSHVEVSAEFSHAQGIKEGARVYYEKAKVGQVVDVIENDQTSVSRVVMEIDTSAASKIDSQAAVAVNRIKPGAPLEIYASAAASEFGLQDGQQLKGLNSMIELVAWSLGDTLDAGVSELSGYVDSFQSYVAGEQFQEDRARVEKGVKAMAAIASQTIKTVEKDLADSLSDIAITEEELALAIEQLSDEMSPLAQEMAKSGTNLLQELEKFGEGIENLTIEEQIAGQKLIESLVNAIDKLNNAAEQGVEDAETEAK